MEIRYSCKPRCRRVYVRLPQALDIRLRAYAASSDTSLSAIVRDALNRYLSIRGVQ